MLRSRRVLALAFLAPFFSLTCLAIGYKAYLSLCVSFLGTVCLFARLSMCFIVGLCGSPWSESPSPHARVASALWLHLGPHPAFGAWFTVCTWLTDVINNRLVQTRCETGLRRMQTATDRAMGSSVLTVLSVASIVFAPVLRIPHQHPFARR